MFKEDVKLKKEMDNIITRRRKNKETNFLLLHSMFTFNDKSNSEYSD